MKNHIIILFLVIFATSCQRDQRNLKIFLPENFRGYGAIIFDGEEFCTEENQTIFIQTDSLGIGYVSTGDCFPNSGISGHYFFYIKKGNDYVRINSLLSGTCEEADKLQGRTAFYENGGEFTGYNDYSALIFHIGKCDDSDEIFIMNSPEDRKIRSLIEERTTQLENSRTNYRRSK
jgi:hypothetical protein